MKKYIGRLYSSSAAEVPTLIAKLISNGADNHWCVCLNDSSERWEYVPGKLTVYSIYFSVKLDNNDAYQAFSDAVGTVDLQLIS